MKKLIKNNFSSSHTVGHTPEVRSLRCAFFRGATFVYKISRLYQVDVLGRHRWGPTGSDRLVMYDSTDGSEQLALLLIRFWCLCSLNTIESVAQSADQKPMQGPTGLRTLYCECHFGNCSTFVKERYQWCHSKKQLLRQAGDRRRFNFKNFRKASKNWKEPRGRCGLGNEANPKDLIKSTV